MLYICTHINYVITERKGNCIWQFQMFHILLCLYLIPKFVNNIWIFEVETQTIWNICIYIYIENVIQRYLILTIWHIWILNSFTVKLGKCSWVIAIYFLRSSKQTSLLYNFNFIIMFMLLAKVNTVVVLKQGSFY